MERKTIWSEAGMPGLVLGLATAACFYLTSLFAKPLLSTIIWIVKFGGCIYLMYLFMKKFVSIHDEATNKDSFRFGVVLALLSAFIFSILYYVYVVYVKPGIFDTALSTVMDSYGSMLDSNSIEQLENLMPKLPEISLLANFFYCFIYGTIVSAIISRSVPSSNPFDNHSIDEQ